MPSNLARGAVDLAEPLKSSPGPPSDAMPLSTTLISKNSGYVVGREKACTGQAPQHPTLSRDTRRTLKTRGRAG